MDWGKDNAGGEEGEGEMKIDFFFAWFDMWIGVYYDPIKHVCYFCPLPCCVFRVQRKARER